MSEHNSLPQPPQAPISPEPPRHNSNTPQPNKQDMHELKTAQNLILVSSLAAAVSLLIGGVFLSGAGFICGFIALRKLNELTKKSGAIRTAAVNLKRSCYIALVFCAVAFILMAIYAYLATPVILEALESGEYDNLLNGPAPNTSQDTSAWG